MPALCPGTTNFQVQPRTNHTTYIFAESEVEPIDIEIRTPPSLFKGERITQSPIVFVGEIRILHPIDILANKCDCDVAIHRGKVHF
jgi:hypothetical protein